MHSRKELPLLNQKPLKMMVQILDTVKKKPAQITQRSAVRGELLIFIDTTINPLTVRL